MNWKWQGWKRQRPTFR